MKTIRSIGPETKGQQTCFLIDCSRDNTVTFNNIIYSVDDVKYYWTLSIQNRCLNYSLGMCI